MAVANLVWGFGAIFAGMIADRYGAGRVVVAGTVATMAGMYLMYAAQSGYDLLISGVLLGIGVSGAGLNSLVGAVGRAAPPDKRTSAIASLGMAAGIGGFVAFPYTHLLMETFGWKTSLLLLLATTAVMLPLARTMAGKPTAGAGMIDTQSLGGAFKEALTHPSYLLLTTGFFVCGFHVAFYGVHLPGFVADKGLDPGVAVIALTMVGLANLVGTFIAGQSGRFIEKRRGLELHLLRPLLHLPRAPVPADHARDGHRAQHSARAVLALHRAVDLEPGCRLFRHPMDVDAVRRGVPVASAGLVLRAVARRLSLRSPRSRMI